MGPWTLRWIGQATAGLRIRSYRLRGKGTGTQMAMSWVVEAKEAI